MTTIAITGATGQLGRLVIQALLDQGVPAATLVAAVRSLDKAAGLAARGVQVRQADYSQPATLEAAFKGVDKLLLISSSEVGQRAPQHQAVIDAARKTGVKLLAYTSFLHAGTSTLALAEEHKVTEAALARSGVPYVVLRNGWYTENYLGGVAAVLESGVLLGAAGAGRISFAARQDFAEAAAAVLTASADQAGKVYELGGDVSYTLADLAAEIARQSGKSVVYKNLSEADYKAALQQFGLPEGFAGVVANSDAGAAQGGLRDDGKALSGLIGRPTTPLATLVARALA